MPELILDKEKCLRNMEKMVLKARNKGLDFRPLCLGRVRRHAGSFSF